MLCTYIDIFEEKPTQLHGKLYSALGKKKPAFESAQYYGYRATPIIDIPFDYIHC
jgi:hypothetical protein